MRVTKKLFGSKSPFLGLAMQYRLGLIRSGNILRELSKKMDAMQAIELAPYLADAWTKTLPPFLLAGMVLKTGM